jgi:hypothetical protein
MFDAITQLRRTVAVAVALAAVTASGAAARVPDGPVASSSSHRAGRAATAPTRADMAARREARANRAWRAANPPRIIEVSSSGGGGFDLLSAGIGAAVPLTLVLFESAGRRVLRRRRDPEARHQLA